MFGFDLPLLAVYAVILVSRIASITLSTIRMLVVVQGRRFLGAILGFVEVVLFVVVLGAVMDDLDDPFKVVVYALGFSLGTYLGSLLNDKLAIGIVTVHIFPSQFPAMRLATRLREAGYGVTTIKGEGRDGERSVLLVTTERRRLHSLYRIVDSEEEECFLSVVETEAVHGGILAEAIPGAARTR